MIRRRGRPSSPGLKVQNVTAAIGSNQGLTLSCLAVEGRPPSLNSGDTPMIRRKLLIATAIIGSFVTTACSDTAAPTEMQPSGPVGRASFAEGSRPCPAPGTGLPGALNMVHDATMLTIPMARDAEQGNAGMSRAVAESGC
jgi:hypothetical protein